MTDTTTTDESGPPPEAEDDAGAAAPVPPPPEKPSFWHRRYVEKFLVPLVLPLVVLLTVAVYVLNVSRLFLSAHGNLPIIIGTTILLVVLIGASILSSGERMQTPTVILLTSVFLLSISFAGWISLGHSEESGGGQTALPATLKTKKTVNILAAPGGQLIYQPNEVANIPTGLVKFVIKWAGTPHTFSFHEDTTDFGELTADGVGNTSTGVAFFGAAGAYQFFCSIPGHEAAGMKGTVTVTGPTVTLEQALVAAGNPPGAATGGGE